MQRVLLFSLLAFAACRPDPGVPDYSTLQGNLGDGGVNAPKPGPFPYVTGTRRLSFGIFYEGGSSQLLPIEDYFIFSNSYSTAPSDERVEGLVSDQLDFNGTGFWGGGVFFRTPTNMTGWTTLHVSLRSDSPDLGVIAIRALSYGPSPANAEQTFAVRANDYGWVADGNWHSLSIPLADLVARGLDLGRMRSPFTIGNEQGAATAKTGDVLLIDDVYVD